MNYNIIIFFGLSCQYLVVVVVLFLFFSLQLNQCFCTIIIRPTAVIDSMKCVVVVNT